MAITIADLGNAASASTPTSLAIASTLNNVAAHNVNVLWHYANGGSSTATSVTDTAGNVYQRKFFNSATIMMEIYICLDAIAMASGNAITIPSFNASALRHGISAVTIAGLLNVSSVFDSHTGSSEASTGTSSPSTLVNAIYAAQMIALCCTVAGGALGTYTPGGSFSAIGGSAATAIVLPSYQILSSVTPALVTAPSWVNSVSHRTTSIGLVGIPAANTSRQTQMSLMGVGG